MLYRCGERDESFAAISAQAVWLSEGCVAKFSKKHVGFVLGSGAWSLTELCYLRVSASSSEKAISKAERLINLFLNR